MKHANENLGPTCGPANLDLCDEKQKSDIDAAMAKSTADLDAEIKAGDDAMAKAGTDFEAAVKKPRLSTRVSRRPRRPRSRYQGFRPRCTEVRPRPHAKGGEEGALNGLPAPSTSFDLCVVC